LALARDADAATLRACVAGVSDFGCSRIAVALRWLRAPPAAVFAYYNGRAVGSFLNPNELAAFTLMGLASPAAGLRVAPRRSAVGRPSCSH